MSCAGRKSVALLQNKQLRSNPDGTPRVFWSEDLGFEQDAVYVKALFLHNASAKVRFVGRAAIDGVTWSPAGGGDGTIDGLSAGYTELGAFSFQYLGDPDTHGAHFEIGIVVEGVNSGSEGTVTLSATAEFGQIRGQKVDLTPTAGTLSTTAVPAIIPGADTINTYGCGKVRVELQFDGAPGQAVTLYLATGPTSGLLYVDQRTTVTAVSGNATTLSMEVDAPDAWSTVYYTVTQTTAANVLRLNLVRLP